MSFLDARTLSFLLGKNSGSTEKVDVAPEASSLLDADIDSLFSASAPEPAGGSGSGHDKGSGNAGSAITADNVYDILGSTGEASSPKDANKEDGTISPHWHFILIRCEDGVNVKALIKDLNKQFDERDLLLRAQGWWESDFFSKTTGGLPKPVSAKVGALYADKFAMPRLSAGASYFGCHVACRFAGKPGPCGMPKHADPGPFGGGCVS